MNNKKSKVTERIDLIKISIDMHANDYRVVRQFDHSVPQPAQRFTPDAFFKWLPRQIEIGKRVVVCYEAGCFGYEPARRMQALGVEVLVIAPQSWDEQNKRQVNDKHDATVMCRRLSDYLDGHKKALSVVTIPTREQEAQRAQTRMRHQLRKQVRRMQAMGRSLLLLHAIGVSGRWWASSSWSKLNQKAPAQAIEQLAIWKDLIEQTKKHADKLEAGIRAKANRKELFHGQGELTQQVIERELIDPHRFKNARAIGNYFGLCPSESTTGTSRRMGSITKHGNPRLRAAAVELAWRMVRYQPGYVGLQKFLPILQDQKAGPGARKKAIVAVARRLMVDLWRMATRRRSAGELGLKVCQQKGAAI
jgi:transposase